MEASKQLDRTLRFDGFTLIELLVVLMLISLMVSLAAPRFAGSLTRMSSETVSRKIVAGLLYARSRAVKEKAVYAAAFSFNRQKMCVLPISADGSLDESRLKSPGDFDQYALPPHIRFVRGETAGGDIYDTEPFLFFFFPAGGSSGGEIRLRDTDGREILIRADIITGNIELIEDADDA